jgi:hypothetical protein
LLIESAENDILLFVHDDDAYHGNIVELVRQTFDRDPDASFVTSQIIVVNLTTPIDIRRDGSNNEIIKYSWDTYFADKKTGGFVAQFNTSFYGMRRSKMGAYDYLGKNPIFGDFLLFTAGLLGGNLYVLPEYLAARLQHGRNEVYNEFYKTGHSIAGQKELFERHDLAQTVQGKVYLDVAEGKLMSSYNSAWKMGLLSGTDPKKLLVVYRRLRRLTAKNLLGKYLILRFLMAARPSGFWKLQTLIFNGVLNFYRKCRGPSKFYRQFPEMSISQFAEALRQSVTLINQYLDEAIVTLGRKK